MDSKLISRSLRLTDEEMANAAMAAESLGMSSRSSFMRLAIVMLSKSVLKEGVSLIYRDDNKEDILGEGGIMFSTEPEGKLLQGYIQEKMYRSLDNLSEDLQK